ncbi:uncharacterized protein METZ01_LOCUS410589, partial [marine metagenome]
MPYQALGGAMNTKRSARSLLLISCLATLPVLASSTPAVDRPNVILLMGDDHGWEETGYNGH